MRLGYPLGNNESAASLDFGNYLSGSIHAFKFYDRNANGQWDDGELPLEGIPFQLSSLTEDTYSAASGPDGMVHFNDLKPGQYMLTEVAEGSQYSPTSPSAINGVSLEVVSGQELVSNNHPLPQVWINEFHYDNQSLDTGEFVEIAGVAGTNVSNYQLVFYNGTGSYYGTQALTGSIPDENNSGFGAILVSLPVNGIQNGPDGIALIDAGGNLMELLSYEGSFVAIDGPAVGWTSADVLAIEDGTDPAGLSLQRSAGGAAVGLAQASHHRDY